MKSRAEVDAELSVLKSAARLAEGKQRQELEAARFNLYRAFEAQSSEHARRWCRAARMAFDVIVAESQIHQEALVHALEALDIIEAAIGDES